MRRPHHPKRPSLGNIERMIKAMSEKLDALQAADTNLAAAVSAAVADIADLTAKLAAIPTADPATQAAIDAVAADITAKAKALTDAVAPPAPPAV